MNDFFSNARWIWRKQAADTEHQYVCFRKEFSVDDVSGGKLYISADTDFVAYLNGQEIGRGQFATIRRRKLTANFRLNRC